MRVRRWRRALPLLIGGAIIGSMVTVPSIAHTNAVKSVPGAGQVVRAVDPTQSKPSPTGGGLACTDFGWGAASGGGNFENPCAVWITMDQRIDKASTLAVFGPDDDSLAVAGKVFVRDSVTTTTSRGQVGTLLPGPDTVIFFPDAALPAGRYVAEAHLKDDALLGVHDPAFNCVPGDPGDPTADPPVPPTGGPTYNCVSWSFLVAPTPAAPVITSPADLDALGTRQVVVTGTAEPDSAIEIVDATDTVLGEGRTDPFGEFSVLSEAADGANTITARATSTLTTTSERKWATYAACADAAIATGEYPDVDEIILEEECGVAPAEALPPVLDSASVSFTADVATLETEAPTLTLVTPPDTIQAGESEALIVGTASDNDQVETLNVVVTDPLSNVVTAFTVTFAQQPTTEWSVSLHGVGYFTVSITALDRAGNASETITTTYVSTTGNLVPTIEGMIEDTIEDLPA